VFTCACAFHAGFGPRLLCDIYDIFILKCKNVTLQDHSYTLKNAGLKNVISNFKPTFTFNCTFLNYIFNPTFGLKQVYLNLLS